MACAIFGDGGKRIFSGRRGPAMSVSTLSAPGSGPDASALADASQLALVRAVEGRFGLRIHQAFHSTLADAGQDLIAQGHARSVGDLIIHLLASGDRHPAVVRMREAASVQETSFFRAPDQLSALATLAISHIAARKRDRGVRRLRVWSAGCATGEEAYSLAILFIEAAPDFELEVLGSDMNASAIVKARSGLYRSRAFRERDPASLAGWIQRAGDVWAVSALLRDRVAFACHNLVTDPIPAPDIAPRFDIIVCRNVLIYIDERRIPEVMAKLAAAAAPECVLALAPAEYPAMRHAPGFRAVGGGLCLKDLPGPVDSPRVPTAAAPPPKRVEDARATAAERRRAAAARALDRGRSAADRGDFDEARTVLATAKALDPDSPWPSYLLGLVAAAAQDLKGALRELEHALEIDRGAIAAEVGLADVLWKMGHRSEARRRYQRALRLLEPLAAEAIVEGTGTSVALMRRLCAASLGAADEGG